MTPDPDDPPVRELPMFPLGSVLLPGMVLPLRVFEPRYRVLVDTVLLADAQEFGVTLIERGSEVGGGDQRSSVGCVARIEEFRRHPDGQLSVLAIGSHRVRVQQWLEDDPFPRALVRDWADDEEPGSGDDGAVVEVLTRVERNVVELARLAVELGLIAAFEPPALDPDPSVRAHQLAILSPLGPLDRQRLLECPGLTARALLLEELVEDQRVLLEAQRGTEGP